MSVMSEKKFHCGVIEGYYGKPWTILQRFELFSRMARFGMSVYMYAPKDDYKHRRFWRELYSSSELHGLQKIIECAEKNNVKFVYALSPGLDIIYSNQDEILALKNKLDQIRSVGCRYFALLFDDIESDLSPDDSSVFESFAYAQCEVTNNMYNYLGQPDLFLFCPTEYCSSRAVPSLTRSSYLKTIGEKLNKNIDFLWTGPKVVSRHISVEGIDAVARIVKRCVTLWDNLHANDYDQTRLYLGPYRGRPPQLIAKLRGVLTNPNCEFEANFIALHTLAQWSNNECTRFPTSSNVSQHSVDNADMDYDSYSDDSDDDDDSGAKQDSQNLTGYNPKRALYMAASDWLPELYKTKISISKTDPASDKHLEDKEIEESKPMETSRDVSPTNAKKADHAITDVKHESSDTDKDLADSDKLLVSELCFLCNFFYLPHENGPEAMRLIRCARWLLDNVPSFINCATDSRRQFVAARSLNDTSVSYATEKSKEEVEWLANARKFYDGYGNMNAIVDRFSDIPNRELLYELYHYVNDMRSTLALLNSYIKWSVSDPAERKPFKSGEQEPWVHRGGLLAEFRRLLPIDGRNDEYSLKTNKSLEKVFVIRPYQPKDKESLYSICLKTCDDRMDASDSFASCPDLAGDCKIGAFLTHFSQYSFVMVDDYGIMGYICATDSIAEYNAKMKKDWLPTIHSKYDNLDKSTTNLDSFTPSQLVAFIEAQSTASIKDEITDLYPGAISLSVLPSRINSYLTAQRLLDTVAPLLRVPGFHVNVPMRHRAERELFTKMGLEPVDNGQAGIQKYLTLAKSLDL